MEFTEWKKKNLIFSPILNIEETKALVIKLVWNLATDTSKDDVLMLFSKVEMRHQIGKSKGAKNPTCGPQDSSHCFVSVGGKVCKQAQNQKINLLECKSKKWVLSCVTRQDPLPNTQNG